MNSIVFASCDEKYFHSHGNAFIKSCLKYGENPWINIVCKSSEWNRISQYKSDEFILSNSLEEIGDRIEYATSRFHVSSQILNEVNEMLILDIDSFLRGPIDWSDFDDCDYSLFLRSPLDGTVGWELEGTRCAAGAVYLKQSAKPFINLVSNTIKHYGSKWFVDQVSLLQVHNHFQVNELGLLFKQMPEKYIDWNFKDESIVWTGKGSRKNSTTYLYGRTQEMNTEQ